MVAVSLDIPVVETERLILRGLEERDFDMLSAVYADEETAEFVGGVMPEYSSWRVLTGILGHWVLRGFGMFNVEEKATGLSIGFCGPWRPHGFPDNEIAYAFMKQAQGKGYATEAATAALRFSYTKLGWTTAISQINPLNHASQKVAEKLGAFNEQQNVVVNDKTIDIWRHLPPKEFMERYA